MRKKDKTVVLKVVVFSILIIAIILAIVLISVNKKDLTNQQDDKSDKQSEVNEFVHPGILHSEESIDYIKYAVEQEVSPNIETWRILLSSGLSDANWNPGVVETAIRGGEGDNISKLYIDIARAYQCALIWNVNGSEKHGEAACRILNGWSEKLKSIGGNADRYLASGLFGYQIANASELLRNHKSFKMQQMQDMLLSVFYPMNARFLVGNEYGKDHNDAYISNYWANWDLCNIASVVSIGIFCDSKEIYNQGILYYTTGLGNGSIYNAIPYIHDDGTAQWQESGRDQGHANLGLGLMTSICEMAWNQGDDLYSLSDNRLLKAAEYVAKYNNGEEVLFSEYEWGTGQKGTVKVQSSISSAGRGEVRPIWSMIYNHYKNRMGLDAPNIKKRLKIIGLECGAGGHATTYDQPGWGTLTFANNIGKQSANQIEKILEEGTYKIVSVHTGKALSVTEGGNVCQAEKQNKDNQIWKVVYVGGGEYSIQNVESGFAMTVENASHKNGAKIITEKHSQIINQKFSIMPADSGNYRIISAVSSKAIDIKDWSDSNNATIFQWRYVMGNNQKWYFEKIS